VQIDHLSFLSSKLRSGAPFGRASEIFLFWNRRRPWFSVEFFASAAFFSPANGLLFFSFSFKLPGDLLLWFFDGSLVIPPPA